MVGDTPKPVGEEPLSALFWDESPAGDDNPDQIALNSVLAESTPDEKAESLKVHLRFSQIEYQACSELMASECTA